MPALQLKLKSSLHSIPYFIGHSLREPVVQLLHHQFPHHCIFVIADSNISNIYGEQIVEMLSVHQGYREILSFPAGEPSKSREWKRTLEDRLLEKKAGRDTVLLAIGGGVTGDLAGFVAATLHRGVPLIHLPTSLLAQVDSSIGGKVGINHPMGKNLLGAFYHPEAVFTDTEFLKTLPEEEYRNGLAEIVKYAVILDAPLWRWLETEQAKILNRNTRVLLEMISRCVELKIQVVEKDEKETRYRSILNFGHSVGHAVEKLSHYQVKHGFAVAAGMRIAAKLSHQLLGYSEDKVQRLTHLLTAYEINQVNLPDYPPDEIWTALHNDKKSLRQKPRFTLLDADGKPALFHPVSREEFYRALAAC